MNSLTYLTRQLGRSASSDKLSQQGSGHLRRSETWSKPFYFRRRVKKSVVHLRDSSDESSEDSTDPRPTIARSLAHRRAKRSFSSPALLNAASSPPSPAPSLPSCPTIPPLKLSKTSPTPSCSHTIPAASELIDKESYLYRRLRQLPLVRAFVLIWEVICATYDHVIPYPQPPKLQENSSTDKDSEDEALAMSLVTQASDSKRNLSEELSLELTPAAFATPPPPQLVREPSPSLTYTRPPSSLARRQNAVHRPKTLVLDLDETLIHSTIRPMRTSGGLFGFEFGGKRIGKGHVVEVLLNGRKTKYHVYKRPFVDYFLRKVSSWYTIVIFTASMQEYADPVIDWLDAGRGVLDRRFFRDSCTPLPSGSYTKDLTLVEEDLARVCLVDNSPVCYSVNPANAIPIEGWTHDLADEALLDLLPVLDSLRFTNDVRRVLGLRGFT